MAHLLEHRHYLQDPRRFAGYDRALSQLAPQRSVLDLGAGSGLLGLTALRHGARQVYAVEATGLADWTQAIATRNSRPGEYVLIRGSSLEIDLPERVDLVVCDQLGAFICEGMALPVLADAAQRHLKPGGQLIPRAIEFGVQALQSEAVAHHLGFWDAPHFDLDMSALRDVALGTPIYERSPADALAGPPGSLGVLDAAGHADAVDLRGSVQIRRSCHVNGLAGFFTAHLAPDATITTAPGSATAIDRDNIVLPLDPPFHCAAGDTLDVRIRALLRTGVLVWTVCSAEDARRRHSTWQGFTATAIPRD